jgi:hypothetical protein
MVSLEHLAVIEQRHRALALYDHDSVGLLLTLSRFTGTCQCSYQQNS